jgi:glucose 1-dehydrogenase
VRAVSNDGDDDVPDFPQRLAGRFALVTGASRGIGRAIAIRYAAEGATVGINHVHDDAAAQDALAAVKAAGPAGAKHRVVEADVADEGAVTGMIEGLVREWGRLDILVNNAGMQTPTPGDSFSTPDLRKVLSIDLEGPAYGCRAAIAHFLSRPGGGVVVNTTSVHEIIPKPGYVAYAMAKAGLGHLTRTLALEYADKGIRVNAVGPGAVITDMNAAWINDPKAKAGVESHIPMGRAATVDDIAPLYAFLASDESAYITGQTIYACGGITLYGEFKQNWAS